MDTSAVHNLEFRGEDSEECNKFISAVLNYAFTQGKQRDDEWVADFVATCFRDDALRWWTGLNPQTQESWKQLRHAMTQYYRPSFYGRSGEEAEQFVHLVYKRALDAGKQGDNQWIAEFVPTCFKGGALRWVSSLDSTVRNDWGLLQEAIFKQYPSDAVSADLRTMPTLAAAAAPTRQAKPIRRGRIRIERLGVSFTSYVSRRFGRFGMFTHTESRDDALQVEYDSTCDGLQEIVIPEGQVGRYYDIFAIRWNDDRTPEPDRYGSLCALNSKTSEISMRQEGHSVLRRSWKIVNDSASTSSGLATIVPTAEGGDLHGYIGGIEEIFFAKSPVENGASLTFEPV